MSVLSLSLLVLCCICFGLSSAQSPSVQPTPSPINSNNSYWQGTWTNHFFGGSLYICQNGRQISGTFSQIGWIDGTVYGTGESVSGSWGYAGFADDSYGTFNWTLSPGGKSFSGIFTYNVINCVGYNWSPTGTDQLISTLQPSQAQCQPSFSSAPISTSSFTVANSSFTLSLCLDNSGNYIGVYTDQNGTTGAVSGTVLEGGLTLAGSYVSATGYGIEFYRPNSDGTVYLNRYPNLTAAASLDVNAINTEAFQLLMTPGSAPSQATCLGQTSLLPTWEGAWTDVDFGYGRSYFCQSGDQVWGVYSQVGWIEGTVDAQSPLNLTGRFYDAGDPAGPGSGNFSLSLAADANSFSGFWIFDGGNQSYSWDDTRVSLIPPTVTQCVTLPLDVDFNVTLAGSWTYQYEPGVNITLDLCLYNDTGRYEYSFSSSSSLQQGYGEGWIEDSGESLRGQWYTPTTEGIEFLRMLDSVNLMIDEMWDFNELQDVQYFPCNGNEINAYFSTHVIVTYYRVPGSDPQRVTCSRNSFLSVGVPDPTNTPSPHTQTPVQHFSSVPTHGPSHAAVDTAFSALVAALMAVALFAILF